MHVYMYVCTAYMYSSSHNILVHRSIDQPVANLVVVSLRGKMNVFLSPLAPKNLVLQDGFDRPVRRHPDYSPHSSLI